MIKLLLALLMIFSLPAEPASNAREELVRLQQQAHAARDRGDKEARLQAVIQLRKLLNETPKAVGAAAKAYAESGENDLALAELSAFADLEQADDALLGGKDPFVCRAGKVAAVSGHSETLCREQDCDFARRHRVYVA